MTVLGLTGSIGMGKSTAARLLREMGVPVHDADATVHALLSVDGGAVEGVAALFPQTRKTDSNGRTVIDRARLGEIIFSDAALRRSLEDILHPLVRADSDNFRREMAEKGHSLVVLDIPLLFETGGEERVDASLCISAPLDIQRARVLARSGMTVEKFHRILAEQMSDAEKRSRATYVIDNDGDIHRMRLQLQVIVEDLKK